MWVKWALGSITINKASRTNGSSAELFQILKMMLLKCCNQYASKFGELRGGHRSEKGSFSFQSQRREMPKNVQITVQLHSFHILVGLCAKSFKLDFSSTWSENFQMYKQGLKKAEEPEMKLPTFAGSYQKQCNSKSNIYFCFHQLCWSFWLCGSQQTVGNS